MKRMLLGFVAMMAAFRVVAVPTGEIAIVGLFSPDGGTSLGSATGVNFSENSLVVRATGSFAGYLTPFVSQAELNNFTFDPFTDPVDPLWSAGGFTFRLDTITVVSQSDAYLVLSGAGVLAGNGLEETPGTWEFLGLGSGIFAFRSDETVVLSGFEGGPGGNDPGVGVPDGGNTLVFLGLVLTVMAGTVTWFNKRRSVC